MNDKQTEIIHKALKQATSHGMWMGLAAGIVLGLIAGFAIGEHMGTKTVIVPLSEGVKT
jgi:hypothetical protein